MFILIYKNKYGGVDGIRTIRDKNKKDLFDHIDRIERKDKYLTIIQCEDFKIVYNSGVGDL